MDINEIFDGLERRITLLKGDLETLRQENGELKGQVQDLQEKISVVTSENEQFKSDKEAVKERIGRLISRLDDADDANVSRSDDADASPSVTSESE